jgi:hypothetical protein
MNSLYFVVFTLLLVIIISVGLGILYNNNEGFVNTQSCISLTTEHALEANRLCNNMIGSDASNCANIIVAAACPIDGVAKDALILKFKEANNIANGTELPPIFDA